MKANVPSSVVHAQPAGLQRAPQRISLPYLNRVINLSVDDVVFLRGEGNYTFIHTRDRKKYLISKTLKGFEQTLGREFMRVHKSYIVNLAFVQSDLLMHERTIRMAGGQTITVSRRRLKEIAELMRIHQEQFLN